jgi:hypothetical protein
MDIKDDLFGGLNCFECSIYRNGMILIDAYFFKGVEANKQPLLVHD